MPLPPPVPDPYHTVTRLLVVAEMLEQAVAEVRRAMEEIQADRKPADDASSNSKERRDGR